MLQPWIKSLVNHLYWTAASSFDQSGEHMLAKWNSVGNHIINIHSGHSQLFFAREHAELAGRDRQKRWLKPGIKHIQFKKEKKKGELIVLSSIGQYFSSLKLFYISESKYLNIFQLVI